MRNIKERLDQLKEEIKDKDFLEGNGLSNEVNIRIFCYSPEDEMIVKHFVKKLTSSSTVPHIIELDLYKTFLSLCEDLGILDAIPEMEKKEDGAFLLKQLQYAIRNRDYVRKAEEIPHQVGDILLVTGVGEVYPFIRLHSLLESLQVSYSDIPILVMYPGTFDGHSLKLFNRLKPNNYYRAFNMIGE